MFCPTLVCGIARILPRSLSTLNIVLFKIKVYFMAMSLSFFTCNMSILMYLLVLLCKRSGCCATGKPKFRGEAGGKENRFIPNASIKGKQSQRLPSLLIPPKCFIGRQGKAEQRKGEVGQEILEKQELPRGW